MVQPPSPEQVDAGDLAWLAGLLEGEGSFFPGSPSTPRRPVISVSMVDRDVIERAAALLGRKPHAVAARRSNWQPSFAVRLGGARAVEWMTALRPLLGERRRAQVDRAIASYRPDPTRVLDDARANEALGQLLAGVPVAQVAERYGTSIWSMYDLRGGRSYRHLRGGAPVELEASASTMPGVDAPTVVILAAGQGTRMRSRTPKVLHEICGRPLVLWPVLAARAAGAGRIVVVDGPEGRLAGVLPDGVETVVQRSARGTGDAVRAAVARFVPGAEVIVLSGDVPLITAEAIAALAQAHSAAGAAATVATMVLEDPSGYGRVVRDARGGVARVVETKAAGDATAEELALREVNTGIYAFDGEALAGALERIEPTNAQSEYYLPDALPLLLADGRTVAAHVIEDEALTLGVNDRVDLARVRAHAQRRIHDAHARAGVTIVDPASTLIDAGVTIGPDTVIEPSSFLRGATAVGERCVVGPLTTLVDSTLGEEVRVPHSYVTGARIAARVTVGPFAHLRPDAELQEGSKAGTFVEIKSSVIGPGAKVPHLSYVGDADVGEGSNLGAGTITANYDGVRKHRTTIGRKVRISVGTALVAPVTVGDGAYTGAGSVITEDVPPGALGIARERQRNVEGYAERSAR